MRAEPRVRERCNTWRVSWLGLLLVPAAGCFPYALPPSQLSFATGPTNGYIADSAVHEPDAHPSHYNLRGGFHPLGAIEGMSDRSVDVGVGYQLERARPSDGDSRFVHGPYLELDGYAIPAKKTGASVRVGARGTFDLLLANYDYDRHVGAGGMLAALVEFVDYGQSEFTSDDGETSTAGITAGELSIGGFLGASYRNLGAQSYWGAVIGVTVRLPFVAGVACCYTGSDSSSSSSDSDDGYGSDGSGGGSAGGGGSGGGGHTPAHPSPSRTPARPSRD